MRLRSIGAAVLLVMGGAGVAGAQEDDAAATAAPAPVEVHREGDYGGVAPGTARGTDKPKPRKKPKQPTVTWVGFQPLEGGASRIFLQLSASATYSQAVAGDTLVVTIPDFRVDLRNNSRPLDTRFFDTSIAGAIVNPVRSGKGKKARRSVEVRVQFKDAGSVRQGDAKLEPSADGFHYLYLDFPPPTAASSR